MVSLDPVLTFNSALSIMAAAQNKVSKELFYKDHYILVEYRELQKYIDRIQGVYVLPSESNLRIWEGVVFVRQSFYAEGFSVFAHNIFRV